MWRTSLSLLIAITAWGAERYQASEPHMGTLVTITLYAASEHQAQAGFSAAFGRIAKLDSILSDYKPDSELSRICETGSPGPELGAILVAAQELAQETDGAFDITAGALTHLWRRARSEKQLPLELQVKEALSRSGYRNLQVSADGRQVRCLRDGMQLDAGGIAKGFAADEALAALRAAGVRSALVAVSGDIAAGEPPPGQTGWRVRVQEKVLSLAHSAVSTSGDEFQFAEIGGIRYSHIIDPRTGMPLHHCERVSVVAPSGIEADSLATAFSVIGQDPPSVSRLLHQHPGVRLIYNEKTATHLPVSQYVHPNP